MGDKRFLDEVNMNTIIVEVPLVLMAMHFKQHPHKLFSHFPRSEEHTSELQSPC